jgi:hypothetical protein
MSQFVPNLACLLSSYLEGIPPSPGLLDSVSCERDMGEIFDEKGLIAKIFIPTGLWGKKLG